MRGDYPGWIGRKIILILSWVLLLSLLGGCEQFYSLKPDRSFIQLELPEPPPNEEATGPDQMHWGLLYFADTEGRFLVPVYRPIPYSETIIRDTLCRLIPTPETIGGLEDCGLRFVIPKQAEVLGISLNEGLAKIDFNAAFLNYNPDDERLVLGSMLCTLHQFVEIERLQLLVDGAGIEQLPGGSPGLTPWGPECWVNLEVDEGLEDYGEYNAVQVYFCYYFTGGKAFYVPVTRVLAPDEQPAWAAFRELLSGPRPGSGLFSEIPAGTELLQLTVAGPLITLDFNKQLLTYRGGRTGAQNIINQLLLTAAAIPGVEEVQILIDGQRVNIDGELDFTLPLTPPDKINCL